VVRERRLGEVFIAPIDIVIRRDPLRTRQPDLLFISNARRYIIGRQVIDQYQEWYQGQPQQHHCLYCLMRATA
jgi:hypothetical protein